MSNFKQSRIWTAAVGGAMAVAMVFGASQAMAVVATQSANYTVSVVVDNAFTMTETTAVSFGTVSALATASDSSVLTMNGQTGVGVVTNGATSRLIVIAAGTPGVVTITGAPPSTAMTIGDPAAVSLGNPATSGEATFTADLTATGLAFVTTTNGAGEMVIRIGGTLTTEITANLYTDGTYTGTYVMTVSY